MPDSYISLDALAGARLGAGATIKAQQNQTDDRACSSLVLAFGKWNAGLQSIGSRS